MRTPTLLFLCGMLLLVVVVANIDASPAIHDAPSRALDEGMDDSNENNFERFMRGMRQKRSCVRRGGSCDHRPSDCCYGSSCRCNLWGANCRCQRKGLLLK